MMAETKDHEICVYMVDIQRHMTELSRKFNGETADSRDSESHGNSGNLGNLGNLGNPESAVSPLRKLLLLSCIFLTVKLKPPVHSNEINIDLETLKLMKL